MTQQKSNKAALYILMFNMFIAMGSIGIIIPVMPEYLKIFGAAGQVLGMLIATFALAQFVFSPIAGNLSDQYGRKNLIIFGLIVTGLAQIGFGLATDVWMLFLARFLGGLGSAFVAPPIMAFVADVTTYEERGKGMGMLGAAMSLGFMIGPGIGGFLAKVSLHFPFFTAGAAAILASILSYFLLPSTKPNTAQKIQKQDNLAKQMARSIHMPYFVMLIIMLVFSFGIANFQTTLSLFVTEKFNYTPVDIAIILVVGGAFGVVVQMFIITPLFNRFGEMKVVLVNLFIAAVAIFLILFVSGFALILVVATIFSTATTLIRPAVNTLISKLAEKEQGFAAGLNNAYMSLGNMIGPALAGLLFDWNMNSPYIFGSIILLACFFLALIWTLKKAPHLMHPDTK
ncbi:MFS transporter [Lysinibacillus boronitolerans]|uniref:Multidrug transporter n=1 Tax=Lysinibacillus boronitolerans JCM 21713 = 10a = NBRC 103108 TaxID=1294264 RepID=A0ABR4Y3N5_9BACI|nr:tetracycline resistance MFS efflux pump [Lysinibacillus boronitolerans]KGR88562.1 multidrug transporter [Lysinibacillus boronitolerans JCM 21713 = 10a = NBRC 103108]